MNILISNLTSNIIKDDVIRMFSVFGEVSFAAIVRDKKTGRSKGIAFIEMPIQAQGEQAVLALHQTEIDGQIISVQEIEYEAGEFNN